jgi:uncharacterized membrane protein YjgN (DUF898 family)
LKDLPPLIALTAVVTLFVLVVAIERHAPRIVFGALAALLVAVAFLLQRSL